MNNIIFFSIFILVATVIICNYRIKISDYFDLYDYPNNFRKIHKFKKSVVGAYSLLLFFLLLLFLNLFVKLLDKDTTIILICSVCLCGIGIYDDMKNIVPAKKICFINLILFVAIIFSNDLILYQIYFYDTFSFFSIKGKLLQAIFTVLCIFLFINAFNLSDGINGLATGISFFLLIYLNLYNQKYAIITIPLLLGVFVIFINIIKKKYFLGNGGSNLISSFLAMVGISYLNQEWAGGYDKFNYSTYIKIGFEHIFIALLIPVIDMLRLFIVRILNKQNPFYGDNHHFHHYLIKKKNLTTSLTIYFLLMNVPILIAYFSNIQKYKIIVLEVVIYLLLIFYFKKK